jgi:hypothetical protein
MKEQLIEKLKRVIFLLEDNDEYDPHVAALNEAIAALTSVKSEIAEDRDKEMQSSRS